MFDGVIACDLWFGPPAIKNPDYAFLRWAKILSLEKMKSWSCIFLEICIK